MPKVKAWGVYTTQGLLCLNKTCYHVYADKDTADYVALSALKELGRPTGYTVREVEVHPVPKRKKQK